MSSNFRIFTRSNEIRRERLTVVSKVPETSKKSKMKGRIVWRLLDLNLPTTLRGRPPPRTLVLSDLMLERRSENLCRDSLHPIRFVELSVDLVEVLVVLLKLDGVGGFVSLKLEDPLFEVEEGSREGFALERGLSGELAVDGSDDSVDPGEESGERVGFGLEVGEGSFVRRRLRFRSFGKVVLPLDRLKSSVSDPLGEMVHEVEDGLR